MEDLEDTQYFYEDALPYIVPLDAGENASNDEGNEYVAEVGDNSNKNSFPPVNVDIPEYKCQNINVNQLKDNLMKIKTAVWYKQIFIKYFLYILKKKLHFMQGGGGLTKKQKSKKIGYIHVLFS